MTGEIIRILTARNTHLILGCVIDLHVPDQITIQIIIVSTIDIEPLPLFIECLIAIRVLIRTQIKRKIGGLAQLLAKMQADGVCIELRRRCIAVRILEVSALILLVFDAPIPSVRTAGIRDAVLLTTVAAVADADRRLHPLCLLRNDVDDAAFGIRAVEGRCRPMQHLDTVNSREILHRRCQGCRSSARIVLPHTVNQKNHIL